MMLQRLRAAGLVWPIALALPAFAILLGLGTWQMQRMAWKEALIARIEARAHAPPVPLVQLEKQEPGDLEYARARVRGTFLHDREQFVWAPDQLQGPGYDVITPLKLADGRFILVNRGYVTEARKAAADRPKGQLTGEVDVVGLLREPAARGWFTPDRGSNGVWYWRDQYGIARSALGGEADKAVRHVLDAEAQPANPGGWPQGGTTRLTLPNRHIEYALTWYGLAASLVAVLAVFAVGRWRAAA